MLSLSQLSLTYYLLQKLINLLDLFTLIFPDARGAQYSARVSMCLIWTGPNGMCNTHLSTYGWLFVSILIQRIRRQKNYPNLLLPHQKKKKPTQKNNKTITTKYQTNQTKQKQL